MNQRPHGEIRVVYGIQAVRRALTAGEVVRVMLQEDLGRQRLGRLVTGLDGTSARVETCSREALEQATGTTKHQGVAAEVRVAKPMGDHDALAYLARCAAPLVLVLDGIEDPRNFGALLRTADAAGVDLVVYARSRNVGLTPVVSKVASGAAEVQPLAEVANLARFLAALREEGVRIIGTDEQAATGLFDADLTGSTALVLGAEGAGLRRLTRERCDQLVSLPMRGTVESLNVAVAAGVCLYEAVRQRSLAPAGGVR